MAEEKKSYKEKMADLERRRIRGVQKILDGVNPIEVARELEVSSGAVSHWMSKYREKGWTEGEIETWQADYFRRRASGEAIRDHKQESVCMGV